MNTRDQEREMIDHACRGDAAAIDFLWRVIWYFHAADDVIDEPETTPEFKIKVFVAAQDLYCHPFFVRNAHALNAVIRTAISTYADSVAWEKSADPDRRAWADWARHSGLEVILATADICGGWDHRRACSREWREYYLAGDREEKRAGTGEAILGDKYEMFGGK